VSTVKNYFLKIRYIVLISSTFLLTYIRSPLTFARVLSPLSYMSFLSLTLARRLDDLCL
jgi:hypothetical protein